MKGSFKINHKSPQQLVTFLLPSLDLNEACVLETLNAGESRVASGLTTTVKQMAETHSSLPAETH